MIDISDWRMAEPIFLYCQQAEQKAEITRLRENGYSLSMAEYVLEYRLSDFEKWLAENEISIKDF